MPSEIAFAKINLALHVRRRREDGYHELETLFAFADDGDVLTAEPANMLSFEICGPFAAGLGTGEDNLVLRAARALQTSGQGARLILEKKLPIASGIGGGSADAAAALRLLSRLWNVEADLYAVAVSLGADVPACLLSRTVLGRGIGDELMPCNIAGVSGSPILLVNPRVACPTGPVFGAWDQLDRGQLDDSNWLGGRNDLQAPAIGLVPEIAEILEWLQRQEGAQIARMSGSGATCFALFESDAQRDAACAMIAADHPNWWTMAANLR